MHQVAIIEDDMDQARLVASWLKTYGYQASLYISAELFLETHQDSKDFDLLLIDWLLPAMSGLELTQQLVEHKDRPPIIFMTSLQKDDDLARALHSGADDFISKPLKKNVFLARVHAVTRRHKLRKEQQLEQVAFKLESSSLALISADQRIKLTASEFRLMQLFSHSQGHLFTREELADSIWGDSTKANEGRALDLLISRLRKKLQKLEKPIGELINHYGQGYSFDSHL
ncbi:Transcriptional regulatory protein, C terminal [Marinospirillum celere]|uniref:Transcriptional regulatory protein, C terminal n=1 Tax=Marinospirillum celere TaxID=1122252 RepID=A0A1I1JF68_9GAMM|nr:response regulator transcription factor [Marinospirillum celere]SFC44623.1 Transcriptional regulatory protein, C terminal [Marinospirillum celere]